MARGGAVAVCDDRKDVSVMYYGSVPTGFIKSKMWIFTLNYGIKSLKGKGCIMKSLGKVIALMGLIVLSTFGGVYLLKLFGISMGYPTRVVPFISIISGTVLFLKVVDRKSFSSIGLHSFKSTLGLSGVFAVFALIPILTGVIISGTFAVSKPFGVDVLMVVGYYFIVSFAEELLCRGYIYNVVSIGRLKAVVPALAFAGYHFISPEFNILIFVVLFVYGVLFAYMYKTLQNLWPLIMFHMIWNIGSYYTRYYSNPLIVILYLGVMTFIIKYTMETKNKGKLFTSIK